MDWPLVLFLAVVALFAYRGYRKGLLRSLSRVLSLLAGYTASILFTEQVSAILTSRFQLEGIIAFITAALGLFFVAAIAVIVVFRITAQLMPARESPSTASSFGGLVIGLMVGLIVAIVTVWTFTFVRDFRGSPEFGGFAQASKIEAFSRRAAGQAATTALSMTSVDPEVARLSVAVIETPAKVSRHAQQLMSSDDLPALLADPQSQAAMYNGDVNTLQYLPAFQKLVNNPDFLALARSSGMLTDTAENSASSELILATRITEIWGRVERVKNDGRVQEILNDPEFQQKVQSGNPVDMLTNPRLLELANIIFSDTLTPEEQGDVESGGVQTDPDLPKASPKKAKIYSWTDENGRLHISDIKPGS